MAMLWDKGKWLKTKLYAYAPFREFAANLQPKLQAHFVFSQPQLSTEIKKQKEFVIQPHGFSADS